MENSMSAADLTRLCAVVMCANLKYNPENVLNYYNVYKSIVKEYTTYDSFRTDRELSTFQNYIRIGIEDIRKKGDLEEATKIRIAYWVYYKREKLEDHLPESPFEDDLSDIVTDIRNMSLHCKLYISDPESLCVSDIAEKAAAKYAEMVEERIGAIAKEKRELQRKNRQKK